MGVHVFHIYLCIDNGSVSESGLHQVDIVGLFKKPQCKRVAKRVEFLLYGPVFTPYLIQTRIADREYPLLIVCLGVPFKRVEEFFGQGEFPIVTPL